MSASGYLLAWCVYLVAAVTMGIVVCGLFRHVRPVVFQFLLRLSVAAVLLTPCLLDEDYGLWVPAIAALGFNFVGLHTVPLVDAITALCAGIGLAFLLAGVAHHVMKWREEP